MTQQQASELERAMAIAKERGHKVFTATINSTGATCYTVRSYRDPNTFHILHIESGRIRCDCQYHHRGHICSHAAAVRLFLIAQRDALKQVEALDAQAAEAERLANLPRALANVTTSEAENLSAVVQANGGMPVAAAQPSMAARAERAILYTDNAPFSLFK